MSILTLLPPLPPLICSSLPSSLLCYIPPSLCIPFSCCCLLLLLLFCNSSLVWPGLVGTVTTPCLLSYQGGSPYCRPPHLAWRLRRTLHTSFCSRAWRGCTACSIWTHRAPRSCWNSPSGEAQGLPASPILGATRKEAPPSISDAPCHLVCLALVFCGWHRGQ